MRTGQVLAPALARRLREVRGFVLDLDGTLVLGDRHGQDLRPLPGAVEFTRWLAGRGLPYRIFTNGTAKTPAEYARTLRAAGFELTGDTVMTPASAAVDLFCQLGYWRVLALGAGLAQPLRDAGVDVVPPAGRPAVDAVLVGQYREFTMDALEAACHAIWHGASLYSCSQGAFFATAEGRALGTSRAITAMITGVTGCRYEVVGKPSRHALRAAGRRLAAPVSRLAVVGDDPDLEVPMAHRGRALAIAVATGLAGPDAFAGRPEHRHPHLMLSGVDELLARCREVHEG